MFDLLSKLPKKSMITIDEKSSRNFTGCEDFVVDEIQVFTYNNIEILNINLGDFYLIGSNLDGDTKLAICELYDEGFKFLDSDRESFADEIEIDTISYKSTFSTLEDDADEYQIAFCEYTSTESILDYLLIKKDDDHVMVFQGIEIYEPNIIL